MTRVHVLTVHWKNDQWIDPQREYLSRYLDSDYATYAYLDGIDRSHYEKFDKVLEDNTQEHATKLNVLAQTALEVGDDDDILLFVDGDAFPIGRLNAVISRLRQYPLIAVKRLENNGDRQPHPCFCLTTVGFWRAIEGDWQPGTKWRDDNGRWITDVGGTLLGQLEQNQVEWKPLLRTNRRNYHPLWFGVYGDVVYHHGAGFRQRRCRRDSIHGVDWFSAACLKTLAALDLSRFNPQFDQRLTNRLHRYMKDKSSRIAEKIMDKIRTDQNFVSTLRLR